VILGHLVPAGTGFHTYQQSEVRIRPQALEGLAMEKEDVLARHFPLLDSSRKEKVEVEEPDLPPALQSGGPAVGAAISTPKSLDSFFVDDEPDENESVNELEEEPPLDNDEE
jgi:DNA-directed RNA polymerase subunit beta'